MTDNSIENKYSKLQQEYNFLAPELSEYMNQPKNHLNSKDARR